MHFRISAIVAVLVLAASFVACSKKDQTQTQNQQPATTASDTGSTQANPPAGNMSQSQPAVAPAPQQAPAPAPQAAPAEQAAAPPPAPQPPPPIVIPASAHIVMRLGRTIDTKTSDVGDTFSGTLAQPITVNGAVVVPRGTRVSGAVVTSKSPGKFKGEGELAIHLTAIDVRGVSTPIQTSTYRQTVKGKGKRTAKMAGGGAGAGLLIGGIAGGGKGALVGGLVGAGAGTAGAALTGNKEVEIPAESVVTFKLRKPVTVNQ
jgi:hypothetical protein